MGDNPIKILTTQDKFKNSVQTMKPEENVLDNIIGDLQPKLDQPNTPFILSPGKKM